MRALEKSKKRKEALDMITNKIEKKSKDEQQVDD